MSDGWIGPEWLNRKLPKKNIEIAKILEAWKKHLVNTEIPDEIKNLIYEKAFEDRIVNSVPAPPVTFEVTFEHGRITRIKRKFDGDDNEGIDD